MIRSFKNIFAIILALVLISHQGCGQENWDSNLDFDHILLFVSDEAIKDSLAKIFTPADKLTTEHKSQGTIGYYYLFFNTYIELLFLQDSAQANLNQTNFGSDYVTRWTKNPIGFGMIINPADTLKDFHVYRSADAPVGEFYLMSKHNNELSQPFVYVSQPKRAYKAINSLEDINQRPKEIREDLRHYLTHKSKAKRLTQIIYTHTDGDEFVGNLKLLEESPLIQIKKSYLTSITLVFDNGNEGTKEYSLGDQAKLVINY